MLEPVVHADAAEHIPPEEARQIAAQVEQGFLDRARAAPQRPRASNLLLYTMDNHNPSLRQVILRSEPAQVMAAAGEEVQPAWAQGAVVLAPGLGPGLVDAPLGPHHIILYARDLGALEAAWALLPSDRQPRQKRGVGQAVPSEGSLFAVSTGPSSSGAQSAGTAEDREGPRIEPLPVTRTFVHYSEQHDPRSARSA